MININTNDSAENGRLVYINTDISTNPLQEIQQAKDDNKKFIVSNCNDLSNAEIINMLSVIGNGVIIVHDCNIVARLLVLEYPFGYNNSIYFMGEWNSDISPMDTVIEILREKGFGHIGIHAREVLEPMNIVADSVRMFLCEFHIGPDSEISYFDGKKYHERNGSITEAKNEKEMY